MIQTISQNDYAFYRDALQGTIGRILPKLGFAPAEVQAVIAEHAQLGSNLLLLIETAGGQRAYCALTSHAGGWTLHSLFPSEWSDRYEILRDAFVQIRTAFLAETDPGSVLHFGLNEDTPTHQFYFAALLPDLGFQIRPRISMSIELGRLVQVELPDLPKEIREIDFAGDRIPALVDCFSEGFRGLEGERSREAWEDELAQQAAEPDAVRSWSSLEYRERIIGSCFGRMHGETAVIYELAVLPAFCGQGLGRFLLLRCARRLQEYGGAECNRCALWTYRTLDRALALYYRLGFRRDQLWTEARFVHGGEA
jgi:ribosomal protein S18 acetylase RimI-like enzyme